jgi:hypothetical protein
MDNGKAVAWQQRRRWRLAMAVAAAAAAAVAAAAVAIDNKDSFQWQRWWGPLMAAKAFDSI